MLPEWSKAFWEWRRWVSSLPIIHKGHLNVKSASPLGSVCACYRFEKVIRDSETSDWTTGFSTLQSLVDLAEPKISITITHTSVMISTTSNTKYWTLPEPTQMTRDSSLWYRFFSFKELIFRKCMFNSLFIKWPGNFCQSQVWLTRWGKNKLCSKQKQMKFTLQFLVIHFSHLSMLTAVWMNLSVREL